MIQVALAPLASGQLWILQLQPLLFCFSSSQSWRWTAYSPPDLKICQLRNRQRRSRKPTIRKTAISPGTRLTTPKATSFSVTTVKKRVHHWRRKSTNPRKAPAASNRGSQRGRCTPPRLAGRSFSTKQMIFPEVEAKDKIWRGSKNQSRFQKIKAEQTAPLGSGKRRQRLVHTKEKRSGAENQSRPVKRRMYRCIQQMKTCSLSNKGDAVDNVWACVCVFFTRKFHSIPLLEALLQTCLYCLLFLNEGRPQKYI